MNRTPDTRFFCYVPSPTTRLYGTVWTESNDPPPLSRIPKTGKISSCSYRVRPGFTWMLNVSCTKNLRCILRCIRENKDRYITKVGSLDIRYWDIPHHPPPSGKHFNWLWTFSTPYYSFWDRTTSRLVRRLQKVRDPRSHGMNIFLPQPETIKI